MGKGSGQTRKSYPGSEDTPRNYDKEWNDMVNAIYTGGDLDMDVWDEMSSSQRELALMEGGFTGLISDEFDQGMLYYEDKKSQFVSSLAEALSNELANGMDETTVFTIGYKNGQVKRISHGDNEVGDMGVTNRQSFSTQKEKVQSALSDRKINFIIKTDGYSQPTYYVTRDGMNDLKQYGGFEQWKKGRGEKRRDYVQDDWI